MADKANQFSQLVVWQKAHSFVLGVYRQTESFPKSELYGLTGQFRRAAVSIPANIAEGFRRRGKADKVRFYNIAEGSLEECRYYLILSRDLGYMENTEALWDLSSEIGRLLVAFSRSVREAPLNTK